MRTLMLMLGAVVVIVLVGGVYVWMQPTVQPPQVVLRSATAPAEVLPMPEPVTAPGTQPVVRRGTGAWIQIRDDRTNTIAWQSRVAEYTPRADGSIDVVGPEAEFYLDDGQVLTIQGQRGRFIVPGEATSDPSLPMNTPPSRGDLQDVILTLYSDETRATTLIRCVLPNLAFDNDTLRIGTSAMQMPDGSTIPADQVPVQVRGHEYDFDGKGLTIRWNARDRRLQSLEIAHGESLTKKPVPEPVAKPPRPAAPAPVAQRPATAPARRGRGAVAQAPATRPADPIYRATFERDVRVKEVDVVIASAGSMRVDFHLDDTPSASTTMPAGPATATASAPRTPATQRALRGPLAPTTSAADKPLTITWAGKLTLVPIADDSIKLRPGEQAVELIAGTSPVTVNSRGYEFSAAHLRYRSSDDSVTARSSPQVPIVSLKDPSGTHVRTRSIDFNGLTGKVVLDGPSTATLASEATTAKWLDSCTLTLVNQSGNWVIQSADIKGDVVLEHPKVKQLQTQHLVASFVPVPGSTNGKADLKDLRARGGVKADFVQPNGTSRQISADSLDVTSRDHQGRLVFDTITAAGNVHTADAQQEVEAGGVTVTLAPTTQQSDSPVFTKIVANPDVKFRFRQENGQVVGGAAKILEVTPAADEQFDVTLNDGTVTADQTTLTGPIIKISTAEQSLDVLGAGTLKGITPTTRSALNDFDLSWNDSLRLSGKANTARVSGGVKMNGKAEGNVAFSANSDKLLLDLADPPATQASTRPASKSIGMDALSKKQVRSVVLDGNTSIRFEQSNPQNVVEKRAYLTAPLVRIDPKDDSAVGRVTIPSAGRMLLEDFTTPTTRPARTGPADLGDFSGPWAFSWTRELVFDDATQDVKMLGDVLIVHETSSGEPFRMQSNQITAHLTPKAPSTAQPTTRPAALDIQRLTADGGVQFTSKRISFHAWEMDFDRARELIEARGHEGASIQIFDSTGVSTGSVREASWNTKTQEIAVENLLIQIRN